MDISGKSRALLEVKTTSPQSVRNQAMKKMAEKGLV